MGRPPSSHYLFKNPRSSNYSFRMAVPVFLQRLVGTKDLRYSIYTSDIIEARYRSVVLAREIKKVFSRLQRRGHGMTELAKAEIDRLVQERLRQWFEDAEDSRILSVRPIDREELDDTQEAYSFIENDAREELALCDYSKIARHVDDLLEERGIKGIDKQSETYRYFCRELLKASVRFLEIDQKRMVGNYSDENLPIADQRISFESPSNLPKGELLSKIVDLYAKEQKQAGNWREKSEQENRSSLNLLVEIIGDIPVSNIDAAVMRKFKETLMALPPNMRKDKRYRDKSIQEIVAMSVEKTINPSTINKGIERASSLLRWAVKNGHMERNPADGMQLSSKKRADEYRDTFTPDDLVKLFHSDEYLKDSHRHSYCFWVPVIGLFTGMRLDEICQLHLSDIYQADDGTYVFNVNNDGDKKLKNLSSKRIVPIHDFLLNELKLIAYVESLKAQHESRLFPELRKLRDGYSHTVSKWFASYRERCGIVPGKGKKDFHSFRHTVGNFLKQAEAEQTLISELLGHEVGSITLGRYGKRYNPKLLKERTVDLLKPDVDLLHLTGSRFVSQS